MKHFQFIPAILAILTLSGCGLEAVISTDNPCPPRNEENKEAELEFIHRKTCTKENCTLGVDFDDYIERGFCPDAYPVCKKNKTNSNYHCELIKELVLLECTTPKFSCNDENNEPICVDNKDDEFCGATDCNNLGTNCANLQNRQCTLNKDEGEYQCQCKKNTVYCEENDTCADLKSDDSNCGSCGNTCTSDQLCSNGECLDADCDTKCKHKTDDTWMCANRDNACGTNCQNCLDISPNAFCLNGKCVLDQCIPGTHPEYRNGEIIKCADNTQQSCGSYSMTPDDEVKDCTQNMPENASTMKCTNEGKCLLSACKSGFAVENGGCKRISCAENEYPEGQSCKQYVTECKDGEHISDDRKSCVANTNSSCAPKTSYEPVDCTNKVNKYCSSDGQCACSKDGSTVLNYDGSKCIRKACKGIYGVTESTIDTEKDYCVPTKCGSKFVTDYTSGNHWGACRPKGTSESECNKLPGWTSSSISGSLCWAKSCSSGYKVFHGTCQPTVNACGDAGHNCEIHGQKCSGTERTDSCI